MFALRKKKPPMVGLDISSTSIKLLEMSQKGGQYCVESYAIEPLPFADFRKERSNKDFDLIGKSIMRAVRKSGTSAKLAAVAISGSSAITKVIKAPETLGPSEMEAYVQMEADQYIPYPLEEINLDFQVLEDEDNEKTGGKVDVLLTACKNENVEDRTMVAKMGGLKTVVVDIEPYTIEHAFPLLNSVAGKGFGKKKKTIAIVDIGAAMTSLNVVHGTKLIYTRALSFGGQQLTEDIMRRYGLSEADAAQAKVKGGLPDNYTAEVLNPYKDTVVQQVSRFLKFFFSAGEHDKVDQIMLMGGCALIADMDKLVQANTGTPTTVVNPFLSTSLSTTVNRRSINADAPLLVVAAGLALRRFD